MSFNGLKGGPPLKWESAFWIKIGISQRRGSSRLHFDDD